MEEEQRNEKNEGALLVLMPHAAPLLIQINKQFLRSWCHPSPGLIAFSLVKQDGNTISQSGAVGEREKSEAFIVLRVARCVKLLQLFIQAIKLSLCLMRDKTMPLHLRRWRIILGRVREETKLKLAMCNA